jgi:hypothetical protein
VADMLPAFVEACDRFAADRVSAWPAALRVRGVAGLAGVFEVTFRFTGPDIRATFEWVQIEGKLAFAGGARAATKYSRSPRRQILDEGFLPGTKTHAKASGT